VIEKNDYMKMNNVKNLMCLCLLFFIGTQGNAQVSIGSTEAPSKAALLQLKNLEVTNPTSVTGTTNVTADKDGGGLGLPRVMLVDKTTLQPFIPADAAWTANTDKVKEKHAGLMVYNIYVSPVGETNADKQFQQGIYLWDGSVWALAGEGNNKGERYFRMPPFGLPMLKITQPTDPKPTYDLYAEYVRQFTKDTSDPTDIFVSNNSTIARVPSPVSDRLYKKEELDYVVTYYDNKVIKVNSINTNGVMIYEVLDTDPAPTSFINILFIVK